jgi:DNA-binding NarL/FixJ family response regulator
MAEAAPIRVLLVDDHEMVAESFRRVLDAQHDIEVVGVRGSADAAVSAATELRPDVVIMDYVLPDTDGVWAATQIRSVLPDAKVVLLTGSGMPEVLDLALGAGCAGYLEKTSALHELAPAVRAAAAGELVLSPEQAVRHIRDRSLRPATVTLTAREVEVLRLVSEGLSNKAIAVRLTLSLNTVRTHVQRVLMKLEAHSKLEAVAIARRSGLLDQR